jgi:hypothetical protein
MNGKSGYKISAVFVCLKPGFRRAVGLHGLEELRDDGAPAFGEFQFFQKLPYPPISITPGRKTSGLQVLQSNGTVGAGTTDDGNGIGQDPDLDGFPDLITAVINGFDHGLFDGGKGIILETGRLGAVRSFNQEKIFFKRDFISDISIGSNFPNFLNINRFSMVACLLNLIVEAASNPQFSQPDII